MFPLRIWVFCLCTMCMAGAYGRQKRASYPETEVKDFCELCVEIQTC